MQTFPVRVVAMPFAGPGTQPLADDDVLNTLGLPGEMHTFRPPVVDLDAPPAVVDAALGVLHRLHGAVLATPWGSGLPARCDLSVLDPAVRAEIDDLLGEGEVAVLTAGALRAQETAFTGLWRILGDGLDLLEAAAFPHALRDLAAARPAPAPIAAPAAEAGLMNALPLAHEIAERSAAWRSGQAAHVINLSLLPVTPEDTAWLDDVLGRGGLSVLSRGYGNCRVTATAWPNVWWVQYFNNMDKLVLNSIEIVDLPAVTLAAAEDYAETGVRFGEWLESIEDAR